MQFIVSACATYCITFVQRVVFKNYFRHTISRYLDPCEYGEESKNAGLIHEGIKQLRGFTNNDARNMLCSPPPL